MSVAEDGRRGWPAVIRSDTRISLIYYARRCVFFSPQLPISPSLSVPVFLFFSLVYEVGSELWQLAAIEKIPVSARISPTFEGCDRPEPTSPLRTTRIGFNTTNWTIFFFLLLLFKKLSNSFSSPSFPSSSTRSCACSSLVKFGLCAKFKGNGINRFQIPGGGIYMWNR